MTLRFLLSTILGYLIGSLSVSILLSRALFHKDIRTMGSGNAGAANAGRTFGPAMGVATFLGDFLKGMLGAALGLWLGGAVGFVCGAVGCLLGHCFPVYFGFKGGKAVATAAGITLLLDWRVFLAAFCAYLLVALLSRTASASSMGAAVAVAVSAPLLHLSAMQIGLAVFMCALVLFMHRSNIRRILHGTEPKFRFASRPDKKS